MKPIGSFIILIILFILSTVNFSFCQSIDGLLLKNYKPVSIYKIPQATISKASLPVIDMYSHDYADTQKDIDTWVKTMDRMGIEKTIPLTYKTGKGFDSVVEKYSRYPKRFELWCGFDYTGYGTKGWEQKAVAELVRCYKKGAKGVGEPGDKGEGELYSQPTSGLGIHLDNPHLKPLFEKCATLKMPVNIHVGEDRWMYETADSTNDGMPNAVQWQVDMNKPGKLNHDQLIASMENAVKQNPKTIFIACHFANCCSNLKQLGSLLDKYSNLYADIAARFGEISPVPRYAAAFIIKYQDRLLYGTDNGIDEKMYKATFRILETADEHFYAIDLFNYHWPLYGLYLPKEVLTKLYKTNVINLFKK